MGRQQAQMTLLPDPGLPDPGGQPVIGACRQKFAARDESPLSESNRRHQPYHGCALPTELRGHSRATTRVPE